MITCCQCDRSIAGHKWGKIQSEGWFFSKNGSAYCPDHIPDWVDKWRAGKARES
jgi:hypothetical protein